MSGVRTFKHIFGCARMSGRLSLMTDKQAAAVKCTCSTIKKRSRICGLRKSGSHNGGGELGVSMGNGNYRRFDPSIGD